MRKIVSLLTVVTMLLMLFTFTTSAYTVTENGVKREYLNPEYITFYMFDEVTISCGSQFETDDVIHVEIEDSGTGITIDNNYDIDTTAYITDGYIDRVTLHYGPFYFEDETAYLRDFINVSSFEEEGGIISFELTYRKYVDGVLTNYTSTSSETFATDYDIPIKEAAEMFGVDGGWIQSLTVDIVYNDSISEFYLTYAPSSYFGIRLGEDVPDRLTINKQYYSPNVLDWLATSVSAFMQVEIFPNITISALIFVMVAIPLCITFLKFFAGG